MSFHLGRYTAGEGIQEIRILSLEVPKKQTEIFPKNPPPKDPMEGLRRHPDLHYGFNLSPIPNSGFSPRSHCMLASHVKLT